ncbi:MAG: hypothetical protein M1830_006783 [Pleopsidium flavum]|nr:MAG: hypothetical protein M1830_006783 [Pleopsidium flavum]
MGLPVSGDVEAHGWRRRSRRCMVGRYSLGYVVKRLLVVGLVAVGIGLIIHAFGNIPTKKDQGTDPVPHKPGNIKLPPTAEMCSSAAFIETASFGFENPRDFQFLQVVSAGNDRETGYNVQTLGEVRIRPAVDHMESNIRVDLELHVSDRSLVNLTKIETSEGTLIMNTPLRVSGLNQPCLSIVATIWITPGLALGNMEIGTQNLGIQFYPLLEYTIRDTTYISSVAGSVHMTPPVSKIYSRKTIIETTSSSIRGAFPLYDLLSLTSQSGSMRVDVDPQEAAKVAPAPASFIASSASGSIEAYYPIDRAVSEIPDRDYRVAVKTSSAAIRGDYLHGSSTSLRSSSGSVEAILAPYGPVTQATNILTETQSASTRLTVLSSLTSPYTPMRNFYSSHKLASGSLRLHFPSTWEGEIEGWSMSGSLRIAWEGVRIIKDGRDWNGAWRRLIAVKGNGQGKIKFESMSGSMELEGD